MAPIDMEKQPLLQTQQTESETAAASAEQPTLSQLQANVFKAQREYMKAWSRTTSGKWHRRIMWSVTLLLVLFMGFCLTIIAEESLSEDDGGWLSDGRVPLEAHIMSKCPDAKDCLQKLILPAMQQVADVVDFKLSFIGNATDDDDGVACKHGQQECLGNMIELCAEQLYPDPKIYLGFTMCMTREYEEIPQRSLVEECALEHGMSMHKLNDCTSRDDGAYALDLLKESFNRTEDAGVTKSCTVRLNDEIRCIRDGGEWKDCPGGHRVKDLVKDIRELTSAY